MSKKIFHSILLTVFVVLFTSLVVAMTSLYGYFSQEQELQLGEELSLAARGVELSGQTYLEDMEQEKYRLTWVNGDGKVLYDTQTPAEEMENHGEREEIREALETGEGSGSRMSETLTRRTVYHARRLSDGTVLRISADQVTMLALLLWMFQALLLLIVIAAAVSWALADRLARQVVKPINALDLDDPLSNDIYEEFSPLLRRIHHQNQELAAAERSRREFTANVSHELKTPLQSIIGSAELLENNMVAPQDVPRFVGRIRTEAQRLVALVEDILHLSQMDEGVELPREEVELLELCREVRSGLTSQAAAKEVILAVHGEPATVFGVRALLHELVYNLCDNAIKYNVEGGSVEVDVTRTGQTVTLTVADTG
ncbi:MAG: PAS domain-containing sensor histidine kinase, partial [Oscillospiraceae bacterium]|nr:PAS domain-containing sensor histidine kinase [Oscillospiraceae bacterium]